MRGPIAASAFALFALTCAAMAKEIPIGPKQTIAGMEVGAVYLQPIEMDPPGMMREAKDSDIHLEADIKAAKDNSNGFATGDWIPYLGVTYILTKEGESESESQSQCESQNQSGSHPPPGPAGRGRPVRGVRHRPWRRP